MKFFFWVYFSNRWLKQRKIFYQKKRNYALTATKIEGSRVSIYSYDSEFYEGHIFLYIPIFVGEINIIEGILQIFKISPVDYSVCIDGYKNLLHVWE